MDVERNAGLAFLLSLGAMPACSAGVPSGMQFTSGQVTGNTSAPAGDGSSDGGGSSDGTTATPKDPTTTADPTLPDPTTTSDDPTNPAEGASAVDGSTSGVVGGSSSEGPSTISVSTDPSGPVDSGPSGDPCVDYGDTIGACFGGDPYGYTAACQYYASYYAAISVACGAANDEYVACIAATDCASLAAGGACQAELDAIAPACG